MKVEANSIDELIRKSRDQKDTLLFIDKFIQNTAPGLVRRLYAGPSITMIGYGELFWKGKSKSRAWPLISLAPQKGTTNLYIAGMKEEQPLPQYYKHKLGKVSIGKACIRVGKIGHLKLEAFEELIKDAIEWMKAYENT